MKYSLSNNNILRKSCFAVWKTSGEPVLTRVVYALTGLLLFFALQPVGIAQGPSTSKTDPVLAQIWQSSPTAEALILLREQADIRLAEKIRGKAAKGAYVFQKLQTLAAQTQQGLIAQLNRKGIAHQSLYIVNALYLPSLRKTDVDWIAQQPEVGAILANSSVQAAPFQEEAAPMLRQGVEWGLRKIQAPEVWAKGYTGQGVVIGGQDTGYDWAHPNIIRQYRGWVKDSVADHRYHWYDAIQSISPLHKDSINPCGLRSAVPCDDNAHGTHTMGTMTGDDGKGNQTGVAPGARWIGCRNMERGYGSPFTYLACFQWFLAPTDTDGSKPNPALAPDVINNSWACPEMEGCNPSNFALLERAVDNLRAAGVFVVLSAGNEGPNCQTIQDPPAIFPTGFAVGATQPNDTIARFSSRGPVFYNNRRHMKPDVVAPGVSVRSAIPKGNYAVFSGTSMAGPHAAGVVALMISANPGLRGEVALLEDILKKTALPIASTEQCAGLPGDSIPNPTYGYGRINALAAVEMALKQTTPTQDQDALPALNVFPNPARDHLTLETGSLTTPANFSLYDASGKLVLQRLIQPAEGPLASMSLPRLPAGVYFYRWQHVRGKLAILP